MRFHRSICGFHWRYLGASRHLTSSQASQVASFRARPRFWHGQKYVGRWCAFFFFSSFLFRVYRAAVNIFLIFFTFIECSRDFDTERSMRGHICIFFVQLVVFESTQVSLDFGRQASAIGSLLTNSLHWWEGVQRYFIQIGHMGNDLMRQYVGLAGRPRYHDGLE